MKQCFRYSFFALVLLLTFITVSAQTNISGNKKAQKKLSEAIEMQRNYKPAEAINIAKQAEAIDPSYINVHLFLAEMYSNLKDYPKSIDSYKKAIALSPDFFPNALFFIGEMEQSSGLFSDARDHFSQFLLKKNISDAFRKNASDRIKACNFALFLMQHPIDYEITNLGDSINSEFDEYWPGITADDSLFVITRRIPKNAAIKEFYGNTQEDFYFSKRNKLGSWSKARNAFRPLNTPDNEGAQSISIDGKYLYFTACNRPGVYGQCDLYVSIRVGKSWSFPLNLGEPINSPSSEKQPSISPDGRTLYFASSRTGSKGKMDIYSTTLLDNGFWTEPINLGDSINTIGDESAPFIHSDNSTLYFTSDGLLGMGGKDLFFSRRCVDGKWGKAQNMGYPLNTIGNEEGMFINTTGDIAYFASDIDERKGRDIYSFTLDSAIRPNPVSYMRGKVIDANSKKVLGAAFLLTDLSNGNKIMQARSSDETGEFMITIPSNSAFALSIDKPGYCFHSENFSLQTFTDFSKPFLINILLHPLKLGAKIVLRNVFFETDSYVIKEESKIELDKAVEFLSNNPKLKIEVGGHTDDLGADTYNLTLSDNRARSVMDYLIIKTIDASRLTYKGYGEAFPFTANIDDRSRALNRRTEFTITGN